MSFIENLVRSANNSLPRNREALLYLKGRGVTAEDVRKYRLGYGKILNIQDDGSDDRKRFMETSWNGKKFEGMILFPFTDCLGRVVGMVGRSITDKHFKIFATDEAKNTGFFFGLSQALPEIYRTGRVYVAEAAFDTLALSKVVPNVVGSLTAGLNEEQYRLLRFYCETIVTVFDSDKPGDWATKKAEEWVTENNEGLDSKERWKLQKMDLGYHDPDNCLKELGLSRFKTYVTKKIKDIPPW